MLRFGWVRFGLDSDRFDAVLGSIRAGWILVQFDSSWLISLFFASVRFGSIQFRSVPRGSIRFDSDLFDTGLCDSGRLSTVRFSGSVCVDSALG